MGYDSSLHFTIHIEHLDCWHEREWSGNFQIKFMVDGIPYMPIKLNIESITSNLMRWANDLSWAVFVMCLYYSAFAVSIAACRIQLWWGQIL